jgi:UDPglucose--hexose-1-phosphate uridylyltransferase
MDRVSKRPSSGSSNNIAESESRMSRLQAHPILGDPVITAPERSQRPHPFVNSEDEEACPFCPGNEAMTPPEILRETSSENAWALRVVPNRYPIVGGTGQLKGRHEVIIESPRHDLPPSLWSAAHLERVFDAYSTRLLSLSEQPELRSILPFKNYGRFGGESISHPHSQIVGLPVVPPLVEEMLARTGSRSDCGICRTIADETLIIATDGEVVAAAPDPSRFPFETVIAASDHGADMLPDALIRSSVSRLVELLLARLRARAGDFSLNWVWHEQSAPGERFHRHLSITPRLTVLGGFELATGMLINVVDPREAARLLREAE